MAGLLGFCTFKCDDESGGQPNGYVEHPERNASATDYWRTARVGQLAIGFIDIPESIHAHFCLSKKRAVAEEKVESIPVASKRYPECGGSRHRIRAASSNLVPIVSGSMSF